MAMTIIRNVHLTNAVDGPVNGPVDVVFDRTITSIRPAVSAAQSDEVAIQGGGRFLVPGLIDTHVHLGTTEAMASAAKAGITTVVDLGTYPDSLVHAQRQESGVPAILSAGPAASAPGSNQIALMGMPAESGIVNPADAERYLDWRCQKGSDLIKIIIEDPVASDVPALDTPTITALVKGAHDRGLLTVAHAVTAASFDQALDAGVDILTHAPLDRPLKDVTILRMLEQETIVSPTLIMMHVMSKARLGDRAEAAFRNAFESVRAMHVAGIPIIAGTDANETPFAPVPHGASIHEEIAYLQQAGMTAAEALRAATSGAADAFRLKDRGRISEGLRADFILVDGDPSSEPAVLRHPNLVCVAGRVVTQA